MSATGIDYNLHYKVPVLDWIGIIVIVGIDENKVNNRKLITNVSGNEGYKSRNTILLGYIKNVRIQFPGSYYIINSIKLLYTS